MRRIAKRDANKRKLTETDSLRTSASQTFNYDTEDRLTTWSTDNATTNQNWTLSLVGDWDATVRTGADAISENRTHTDVHEVTAINGNALSYDFKGNLATNGGNVQDYIWDAENRMKSIGNSVDADYRYDALGRRVQKIVVDNSITTTTTFVCGGAQVFTEYVNNVEKQSYVYASYVDDPVALIAANGDTSFYHKNHLFSTEVITDNTGAVTETSDYDSYGKVTLKNNIGNIITASSVGNKYYFTGRRLDSESSLYYYRTRYLDVGLGRFLNRNPWRKIQTTQHDPVFMTYYVGLMDKEWNFRFYHALRMGENPYVQNRLLMYDYAAGDPANSIEPFSVTNPDVGRNIADEAGEIYRFRVGFSMWDRRTYSNDSETDTRESSCDCPLVGVYYKGRSFYESYLSYERRDFAGGNTTGNIFSGLTLNYPDSSGTFIPWVSHGWTGPTAGVSIYFTETLVLENSINYNYWEEKAVYTCGVKTKISESFAMGVFLDYTLSGVAYENGGNVESPIPPINFGFDWDF